MSTSDEVMTARPEARAGSRQRIGELLLAAGLVTEDQLMLALAEQKSSGERLGRILVDKRVITESQLVRVLAQHFGIAYVDLDEQLLDYTASRLIRESFGRRHQALAIGWEDDRLVVAMANPADVFALDDIRSMTGQDVKAVMTEPAQLARAIDKVWSSNTDDIMKLATDSAEDEAESTSVVGVREAAEDAPVVQFVNELITRAVSERASDVHLEPSESELRIRYRVDGVLQDVMRVPRAIQPAVISRIKIMGDVNIAERRLPQDGRLSVPVGGRKVDLRLVTLPTQQGEALIIRILDRNTGLVSVEDLGFVPETEKRYEATYRAPWGAILVTGPTGSGKSTTLYATLNELNDPKRSIITVEDPVEYHMSGIKQVQVNRKAGLTFANALRSILRADPDIVLVGEIRDRETATIAVEAALTGHLVLSTLHTNDAASTPARQVQGAHRAERRGARHPRVGRPRRRVTAVLPGGRLRGLRPVRLPRPVRRPRGHADDRGAAAAHPQAGAQRRSACAGHRGGHDHPSRGRPPQGGNGQDHGRRAPQSRRVGPRLDGGRGSRSRG